MVQYIYFRDIQVLAEWSRCLELKHMGTERGQDAPHSLTRHAKTTSAPADLQYSHGSTVLKYSKSVIIFLLKNVECLKSCCGVLSLNFSMVLSSSGDQWETHGVIIIHRHERPWKSLDKIGLGPTYHGSDEIQTFPPKHGHAVDEGKKVVACPRGKTLGD